MSRSGDSLKETYTSRKHGKKEPQSVCHCTSFDHPDLQSLNDCRFVHFVLRLHFKILRACITPLERYFQDLSSGIFKTPKFLKFHLVNKTKTNMHSFSDCRSRWSKEPQWQNNCGSFLPCFLLVMGIS